ncbi:MAG: homocysteine S-methyltransferase family protein [Vicinamibacterales bacterium]
MRLLQRIAEQVLLADGGMGTQLQRAGLAIGTGGERWNLDHPERVAAIHAAYLEAGSDIVLTNSFGATRWGLERQGLAASLDEVNRAAARIARQVAGPDRLVLGDVGPSGQLLAPLGPITIDALKSDVRARCRALVEAGVDGIICETLTAADEAAASVEAALEAGAPLVVASFAFDKRPNGRVRTMMGLDPGDAAKAVRRAGAALAGANCGTSLAVADFAPLAGEMAAAAGLPVMIQPNAGQPRVEGGGAVYDMDGETFARGMEAVLLAGAAVVGGCCGTGPDHIRALRGLLDRGQRGA